METFVVVTDLCGREPSYCVPLSALDERDEIIDRMVESDTTVAYIGEIEYREATDAERDAAMTD